MSVPREERDARMYDEHQLPQPGIEQKIMEVLGTKNTILPEELIRTMEGQGWLDSLVRKHIWSLTNRGYIEMTPGLRFKGLTEPKSPAPTDFLQSKTLTFGQKFLLEA